MDTQGQITRRLFHSARNEPGKRWLASADMKQVRQKSKNRFVSHAHSIGNACPTHWSLQKEHPITKTAKDDIVTAGVE